MHTYVIKSQGHYKIGKTVNVKSRLQHYATHCFEYELLCEWPLDVEEDLHNYFKSQRVRGEWFALTAADVHDLPQIVQKIIDHRIIVEQKVVDTVSRLFNKVGDRFKVQLIDRLRKSKYNVKLLINDELVFENTEPYKSLGVHYFTANENKQIIWKFQLGKSA